MRWKMAAPLSVLLACVGLLLVWVGYGMVVSSEGPVPQPWLIVPGILLLVVAATLPLMAILFRAPG